MKLERLDPAVRLTRYLLLFGASLYLVMYLVLAILRIHYPYELEWMEGGSLDHVRRILMGEKLYVEPSLEFVPFIYGPLYFYVSAAVSVALGVGFIPLRLVSLVASIGCFGMIFLIVKRETRDSFAGLIASGLFAATFQIGGAWFDLARVDSLFLFLLLAGVYVLRFYSSWRSGVVAGLLFSLSFLTKQTALLIALPLMLWSMLPRKGLKVRGRSFSFIGTIVATVGISTLILNRMHDGWYSYYVFELPRHHRIVRKFLVGFWLGDLLLKLPVAGPMAGLYLLTCFRHLTRQKSFFYLMLALGMLGGAWVSRLHSGGAGNVLIPAYACVSILFGLAIHEASRLLLSRSEYRLRLVWVLVGVLTLTQLAVLRYNPAGQIPTKADAQAGKQFVTMISRIAGDVFIPEHGYLARLAGKNSYAHRMAVTDVLRGDHSGAGVRLIDELHAALREKRYSAIILDSYWRPYMGPERCEEYYKEEQLNFPNDKVFRLVTGARIRPTIIYLPK